MSTAKGTFVRNSSNRLTATFVVDGIQITFNATVSPAVQAFTSNNATLNYTEMDQLTSTRRYSGIIGTDTFKLTLDNGPVMEGQLNPPGLSPANSVSGSGAWEQAL